MENENDQWRNQDQVKKLEAFTDSLKVEIDHKAWNDMYGWCCAAESEVSGLGLVEKIGSTFLIKKAFILPQVCSSTGTKLTEEGKAKLLMELTKKKIPGSLLKFQWHTHYNFGTFWSTTDVDNGERLAGNSGDWMLGMVINQAGDYKCRLDVMQPVRLGIEGLSVAVKYPEGEAMDKYTKDIRDNVTEEKPFYQRVTDHLPGQPWWERKQEEEHLVDAKPLLTKALSNKQRRKMGLPRVDPNGHKTKYFVHGGKLMTEEEYLHERDFGGQIDD